MRDTRLKLKSMWNSQHDINYKREAIKMVKLQNKLCLKSERGKRREQKPLLKSRGQLSIVKNKGIPGDDPENNFIRQCNNARATRPRPSERRQSFYSPCFTRNVAKYRAAYSNSNRKYNKAAERYVSAVLNEICETKFPRIA